MARIQVLELPAIYRGEDSETPFVLVIDQVDALETFRIPEDATQRTGARAILVFAETVDIPANHIEPAVEIRAERPILNHLDLHSRG